MIIFHAWFLWMNPLCFLILLIWWGGVSTLNHMKTMNIMLLFLRKVFHVFLRLVHTIFLRKVLVFRLSQIFFFTMPLIEWCTALYISTFIIIIWIISCLVKNPIMRYFINFASRIGLSYLKGIWRGWIW